MVSTTSSTSTKATKTSSQTSHAASSTSSQKHTTTSGQHTASDALKSTSTAEATSQDILVTSTGTGPAFQTLSAQPNTVGDKHTLLPSGTISSTPLSSASQDALVNGSSTGATSSSMAPGTVAGIIIGSIATATLLAAVILLWLRMQRSRQQRGIDPAIVESRLSRLEGKQGYYTKFDDGSSQSSDTARPRSWSGGASKRFSHLPPIETTTAANTRPSISANSSTWSVVKSPSHEHLVLPPTSSPGAARVRTLHSETPSPAERHVVSPMSGRLEERMSLQADRKFSLERRVVSPIQDDHEIEMGNNRERQSIGVASTTTNNNNNNNQARVLAEACVKANMNLRRTTQIPKLKVVEAKPEVEVDAPMVSPIEEFHDSRQSPDLRGPSPVPDSANEESRGKA